MGRTDLHESQFQQEQVFKEALAIFEERNQVREDLWKEYPADDALGHMRSKLARIEHLTPRLADQPELLEHLEDDALDLINYAAFLVRKARGEK